MLFLVHYFTYEVRLIIAVNLNLLKQSNQSKRILRNNSDQNHKI